MEDETERGIDVPCPKPDAVEGDGPIQYCARCDSAVYDFSKLTADEARALEAAHRGRTICARIPFEGRRRKHRTGGAMRTVSLALGVGLGGLVVAQWAMREPPAKPGAGVVGPSGLAAPDALRDAVRVAIETAETSTAPKPRPLTEEAVHVRPHEPLSEADLAKRRALEETDLETSSQAAEEAGRKAPPRVPFAAPGTYAPRVRSVPGRLRRPAGGVHIPAHPQD